MAERPCAGLQQPFLKESAGGKRIKRIIYFLFQQVFSLRKKRVGRKPEKGVQLSFPALSI